MFFFFFFFVFLFFIFFFFFFFFSSRRRHTRFDCDWSSGRVLFRSALGARIRQSGYAEFGEVVGVVRDIRHEGLDRPVRGTLYFVLPQAPRTWYLVRAMTLVTRSEERRVGKEGRCRWWADEEEKKCG